MLEMLRLDDWLFSKTIIDVVWEVAVCRRGAMLS